MSTNIILDERRSTGRQQRVRHRHVLWNKIARREKPCDGWVCNVSDGGLALLVRNGSRPKVGDQFEVDYHGSQLLCTVVRRQTILRKVSMLGCRAEVARASSEARCWGEIERLISPEILL